MARLSIRIQSERFHAGDLLEAMRGDAASGAVATFLGQVRAGGDLVALELEHYPGVTEAALERIAKSAIERWPLQQVRIVHRIGRMDAGEEIVFVGAAAEHRRDALDAVEFLIDILKTQAPFWKKEYTHQGSRWIDPKDSDGAAAERWLSKEEA